MTAPAWLHPQAYAPASATDLTPGSPMERLVRLAEALVPEDLRRLCDDAISLWEYRAKMARRAGMTPEARRIDELRERIERWREAMADPTKDKITLGIWEALIQQDEAELRQMGANQRKHNGRAK